MTAQNAEYGMDYLNHAQPKDVLGWVAGNIEWSNSHNSFILRYKLTIPCHQFAASVIGRLIDLLSENVKKNYDNIEFIGGRLYFINKERQCAIDNLYLQVNPFHGMTMPDGSPRTSCTREEFETWKKEV